MELTKSIMPWPKMASEFGAADADAAEGRGDFAVADSSAVMMTFGDLRRKGKKKWALGCVIPPSCFL